MGNQSVRNSLQFLSLLLLQQTQPWAFCGQELTVKNPFPRLISNPTRDLTNIASCSDSSIYNISTSKLLVLIPDLVEERHFSATGGKITFFWLERRVKWD